MLDLIAGRTREFAAGFPKEERKKKGQFFTSPETAGFMAGMFDLSRCGGSVSVLDPGAGSGILSAALIERILSEKPGTRISLVCYETDPEIFPLLRDSLELMEREAGGRLEWELETGDYILSRAGDYRSRNEAARKYDFIISNPAFKKIAKSDPRSLAMSDVVYGAPNLYFLFAAMSLFDLRPGAEMVYILPRSWTSGAYFRAFRERLLTAGSLKQVHLFVSRDRVFDSESVLQETVIIRVAKESRPPENIYITSGGSGSDLGDLAGLAVPYDCAVSGKDLFVCLPADREDLDAIRRVRAFSSTLPESGLRMKTGIVVDFRNRDDLRSGPGDHAIPLFRIQHIRNGRVNHLPSGKGSDWISDAKPGLVQASRNYVFLKRFTAKEESRRLQCGIFSPGDYPEYARIATENKINFIDSADGSELDRETVWGVFAFLNSALYDRYYRLLNGSTQVNSTEINAMPFPAAETIRKAGIKLLMSGDLSAENCDRIIDGVTGEDGD